MHALPYTREYNDLLAKPWVGASWEGFVIEQILGFLPDRKAEPYFFRTSDGHEIDLVLDFGNELWAIEVKLTSQPSVDDFRRLNKTADLVKADKRFLLSRVSEPTGSEDQISCSLPDFLPYLEN